MSVAATFKTWKEREVLHKGWRVRVTGAGVKFPLTDRMALRLYVAGYCCTCCSLMTLRLSCTSHKTAHINGVKVLTHLPHTYTLSHTPRTHTVHCRRTTHRHSTQRVEQSALRIGIYREGKDRAQHTHITTANAHTHTDRLTDGRYMGASPSSCAFSAG